MLLHSPIPPCCAASYEQAPAFTVGSAHPLAVRLAVNAAFPCVPAPSHCCVLEQDRFGGVSELRPWAQTTRRPPGAVCPVAPNEVLVGRPLARSSAGESSRRAPQAWAGCHTGRLFFKSKSSIQLLPLRRGVLRGAFSAAVAASRLLASPDWGRVRHRRRASSCLPKRAARLASRRLSSRSFPLRRPGTIALRPI